MDLNNTDLSNRLVWYTGCDETQARHGARSDPREILSVGETYRVVDLEVETYRSTILLEGYDKRFNTVLFDEVNKS